MASIGVRLPEQEKRTLAAVAIQQDMTLSQVLRKLIREYIDGVSQAARLPAIKREERRRTIYDS